MFCLKTLYLRTLYRHKSPLKRKTIPFAILALLTSYLLVSTSQHFVYAQSSPSYNLTRSYIVEYGDSLAAIAARHGVSIQDIATTNSIRNINSIQIGQVLIIPSSAMITGGETTSAQLPYGQNSVAAPVANAPYQPPLPQPSYDQHGSQSSSQSSGTYVERSPSNSGGYVAATPALPCSSAPGSSERIHNVRPGDTLYAIARTYGVSVTAVRQRNGLATDRIRVGECLVVPAGTTITPVPDRRRSSEQPPVTQTATVPSTPTTTLYLPTTPTATAYTQG